MVFKCRACNREFESPAALGAHRALKCNRESFSLPAVIKKTTQQAESGQKRKASAADPLSAAASRAPRAVQEQPLHSVAVEQQHDEASAAIRSQEAAGQYVDQAPQPQVASQPLSPPAEDEFAFPDYPDSPGHTYVQQLPVDYHNSVEFVRWVRSCNRNAGLPDLDVERLFGLFKQGFHPDNLKVHNAKQVRNFEADHLFLEKDVSNMSFFTVPYLVFPDVLLLGAVQVLM
jgi:hypothetical protein